jgi:hypothetical protein
MLMSIMKKKKPLGVGVMEEALWRRHCKGERERDGERREGGREHTKNVKRETKKKSKEARKISRQLFIPIPMPT